MMQKKIILQQLLQKNATFTISDTKLYVPVVTLSTQDDNKKQDLKGQLSGRNISQKLLIRLKLTI